MPKKKPAAKRTIAQEQWTDRTAVEERDYGGIRLWDVLNTDAAAMADTLRSRAREGEDRLLLAALEDAIWTLKYPKITPQGRQHWSVIEARLWLESDEEFDPFCFAVICDHFGLNHQWLRKKVKEFCKEPVDGRRPSTRIGRSVNAMNKLAEVG